MIEDCRLKPFVEFVLNKWEEKETVEDVDQTKDTIDSMAHLVESYVFVHLIQTLCEIYELYQEFYGTFPDGDL